MIQITEINGRPPMEFSDKIDWIFNDVSEAINYMGTIPEIDRKKLYFKYSKVM